MLVMCPYHAVIVAGVALHKIIFSAMSDAGVFSPPRRQLEELFISMFTDHAQDLLDI